MQAVSFHKANSITLYFPSARTYYAFTMDVPALINEAMDALKVDQADLSRKLGVGQPTVSKWKSGQVKPDYESCLRLAQITGKPAADVLRAAGRDPSLLPPGDPRLATESHAELVSLKRILADVRRMLVPLAEGKRLDNCAAA